MRLIYFNCGCNYFRCAQCISRIENNNLRVLRKIVIYYLLWLSVLAVNKTSIGITNTALTNDITNCLLSVQVIRALVTIGVHSITILTPISSKIVGLTHTLSK
jgi:hypothetical protein